MLVVHVPLDSVTDWSSFLKALASALSLPESYASNANAFMDGLFEVTGRSESAHPLLADQAALCLDLGHVRAFRKRCPGLVETLGDWVAFMNHTKLDEFEEPVRASLLLSYDF